MFFYVEVAVFLFLFTSKCVMLLLSEGERKNQIARYLFLSAVEIVLLCRARCLSLRLCVYVILRPNIHILFSVKIGVCVWNKSKAKYSALCYYHFPSLSFVVGFQFSGKWILQKNIQINIHFHTHTHIVHTCICIDIKIHPIM